MVPATELRWGTEVAQTEVLGSPCLTYAPRIRSVRDLLQDARRFPDREYLVQGSRRITFGAHELAVGAAAAAFIKRGVQAGDRVMLFGSNSIEWVIAFWATVELGAIVVLGNAWWSRDELEHGLGVTTPALIVADPDRREQIPQGAQVLGTDEIRTILARGASGPRPDRPAEDEDAPAVIVFTSGTTGLPKGAALAHRGLIATVHAVLTLTKRLPDPDSPIPAASSSLVSLPMFHVGGLQQIIMPMVMGSTLVFSEGRFDGARVAGLLRTERVRVWSAVPTMVSRVLDHLSAHPGEPIETLRTIAVGGAPVTEQLRTRMALAFPNARRSLAVSYGLTETSGTVTTAAGEAVLSRPGTVGRPLATAEVRISSPDASGAGEVQVRAPFVMLGYWPLGVSASSPISSDRWLSTGDIGRLDEEGYLYITDRSKEIVIRGGENIATPHVENRLAEHPAVREAAVIGLPHESLGEELAAVIVLHPGQDVSADALRRFAAETLARFEVPTRWRISHEPLPQNPAGKVLKRRLRDTWSDDATAL